jgi:hypothetical protein
VTEDELTLRRRIFVAFAQTGAPPALGDAEAPVLRGLADHHVVALDDDGALLMAHPFAAHRDGARIDAGGRTWWGNCAWDAYGIKAALGLGEDATITSGGVLAAPGAVFHVLVPAARWWDDVAYT